MCLQVAQGDKMRILVAEDDEYLQSALKMGLQKAGYAVDAVWSGTEATVALREVAYDLLVLDLGLPGRDGTEVLSILRREGQVLPVIIITARDSVDDKIVGLDLGANDYITNLLTFGSSMPAFVRSSEKTSGATS
jgi:Response regulators consisting of a CheY-like receiver domain and a winged-helix DNA-binding domain